MSAPGQRARRAACWALVALVTAVGCDDLTHRSLSPPSASATTQPTTRSANPSPPPLPAEDLPPLAERTFPTARAAALAAMLDPKAAYGPAWNDVDRAATDTMLARAICLRSDLNFDASDELLFDIGRWVRIGGGVGTVNDTAGNIAWAIVQPLPDGTWRVAHRGFGDLPEPLTWTTGGWCDLKLVRNVADSAAVVVLQRFDGRRYRTLWGLRVIGLGEGYRTMTPVAIPPEIVLRIVHDLAPSPPTSAKVARGAAFQGDLDDDGRDELLVQLDRVVIGRRRLDLAKDNSPGNLYLYTRRDGAWEHVLRATNRGPLRMPLAVDAAGLISLETQLARRASLVTLTWYHIREGTIVETGTRRRYE
ncbi:hypothetical protein LCGC14_0125110 [marine sediment metagenome]|uniref:Uncharacterized protein n=1 Tax=marine sediment metagenome TaxID=412755 RepID=A0A0F9XMX2_9ZZZZ|nr:hypothetical protein [Phycisphaerae bacterium]HDZ44971.1 hypothetical protein [Phycisphaerae bacterium]